MARRSKQGRPETLRQKLVALLEKLQETLASDELRSQVKELIPVHRLLRDLGSSLVPNDARAARTRILKYMTQYPLRPLAGEELMIVAGISEWARRVRELRVEHGWRIITGLSASEMIEAGEFDIGELGVENLAPDEYILLSTEPDDAAASRWKLANTIRKNKSLSVQNKILAFLRANVGHPVSGEELRHVANDKTEWARRVRELRTEQGWPVVTKQTGMPELPVGVYVLELDRQAPVHDRVIPDVVRGKVLRRDGFECQECGWHIDEYNRADPRILELHHKTHHAAGGDNTEDNLITLCNICHDEVHAKK